MNGPFYLAKRQLPSSPLDVDEYEGRKWGTIQLKWTREQDPFRSIWFIDQALSNRSVCRSGSVPHGLEIALARIASLLFDFRPALHGNVENVLFVRGRAFPIVRRS